MSIQVLDDVVAGYEKAKPARKGKRVRKVRTAPVTAPVESPAPADVDAPGMRFKRRLRVALGVAIPLLSLSASKIAGTLAGGGHYGLAAFGALIGLAVLAVSLSHLAWAVRE